MRWTSRSQKPDWIRLAALADFAAQAPDCDPVALRRLCAALTTEKRHAKETIAILRRVVARLPEDADVRVTLARGLMAIDDLGSARHEMDVAMRLAPNSQKVRLQNFMLLVRMEQWSAASALRAEISAIDPMHPVLFDVRMRPDLPDSERETQLAACDAALTRDPTLTDGIYFKAIALARLGHTAEARAVLDPDRYLTIGTLAAPDGFGGDAAFRAQLADEIRLHPDLIEDGHLARGRRQTLQLRDPGDVHIAALLGQIMSAVDDYESRLPATGDAFVTHRPKQVKLAAWAIVYDADGHQLPHRHPEGWLSGVYYVTAPRGEGELHYRGDLVVGEVPLRYGLDEPPWAIREIEPVPGRIVLFPSYVPHSTRRANVGDERICVAFDVVPAG